MWCGTNDEIGVAVQSWLWVWVELKACYLRRLERPIVNQWCSVHEVNSWRDRSVRNSARREISRHRLKSHSGQLSTAFSENLSMVNTICISSFRDTPVITYRKHRLKETWWLTKKIAETKCSTEQTMKLEKLYKVCSECDLNSWPDSPVG